MDKKGHSRHWWENDFVSVLDNELFLGSHPARALVERHGTPLFVYGRGQILSNFKKLEDAFSAGTGPEVRICFAMKANPNPSILKLLRRRGAWIDAVSPAEVRAALAAGFPAERILFTGTSVGRKDILQAFRIRGLTVNIDALEQLELMKEARERGFRKSGIRVSIRWNPGIGRGFNPKAVTAGAKSTDGTPIKFGVEESKVLEAFERARHHGFIPVGIHQHLGSGWVREDFEAVKEAVDRMVEKAAELEKKGFSLEFLDFGGGFGPKYRRDQRLFPLGEYAAYIGKRVLEAGLKIRAIAVEPGKYLVGDAGAVLLSVEYVKESFGNLFACVNGGTFNTVPRPAIYMEAYHEIINASRVDARERPPVTVAGHLCETGDVFGKERPMPLPRRGDILAVLCAGAYCRSMSSEFNMRKIPPEILV